MKDLGQLFITGISGLSLNEEEKEFIRQKNIGGVILFSHNFESLGQLAELTNSIQELRDELPLFISVDQEGGRVRRFKSGVTQFPSMLDIAKKNTPKTIYKVHEIIAKELSALGVNVDYSPVCDIFTNPNNKVIGDRAFGQTAQEVEKNISAAIRGLQTNNVIGCAKHFPGHGDSTKDSHFDLPIIKNEMDTLEGREFGPFRRAIKSRVEMVMMAHLVVDAIDSSMPTSLSENAYKILRDKLRFKKIIITDDMEMKAIVDQYSIEEAAFLALKAGADIVLFRSFEATKKCYDYIDQKTKLKQLLHKEIAAKLQRISQCKKEYLSNYTPVDLTLLSKKIRTIAGPELLGQL